MSEQRTRLTARFHAALAYASMLHQDQRRKGPNGAPYVAHLLRVCALVLEAGGTETEAVAALLHDAAEDQGGKAQVERIASLFGSDVAKIVRACSDSLADVANEKKEEFSVRKSRYVDKLEGVSDSSILLVSVADKIDNLRSIERDYAEVGKKLWKRFNGRKDGTLWYYGALARIFAGKRGRIARLGAELDAILGRLPAQDPNYQPPKLAAS